MIGARSRHGHEDPIVLDLAKDAVVSGAIAPQPGKFAAQRLSDCARIVGGRDTIVKEAGDTPLDRFVE
jgi:hypothetical protein